MWHTTCIYDTVHWTSNPLTSFVAAKHLSQWLDIVYEQRSIASEDQYQSSTQQKTHTKTNGCWSCNVDLTFAIRKLTESRQRICKHAVPSAISIYHAVTQQLTLHHDLWYPAWNFCKRKFCSHRYSANLMMNNWQEIKLITVKLK